MYALPTHWIMGSRHCFGNEKFKIALILTLFYDSQLLPLLGFWIVDSYVTTAVKAAGLVRQLC